MANMNSKMADMNSKMADMNSKMADMNSKMADKNSKMADINSQISGYEFHLADMIADMSSQFIRNTVKHQYLALCVSLKIKQHEKGRHKHGQ